MPVIGVVVVGFIFCRMVYFYQQTDFSRFYEAIGNPFLQKYFAETLRMISHLRQIGWKAFFARKLP